MGKPLNQVVCRTGDVEVKPEVKIVDVPHSRRDKGPKPASEPNPGFDRTIGQEHPAMNILVVGASELRPYD